VSPPTGQLTDRPSHSREAVPFPCSARSSSTTSEGVASTDRLPMTGGAVTGHCATIRFGLAPALRIKCIKAAAGAVESDDRRTDSRPVRGVVSSSMARIIDVRLLSHLLATTLSPIAPSGLYIRRVRPGCSDRREIGAAPCSVVRPSVRLYVCLSVCHTLYARPYFRCNGYRSLAASSCSSGHSLARGVVLGAPSAGRVGDTASASASRRDDGATVASVHAMTADGGKIGQQRTVQEAAYGS